MHLLTLLTRKKDIDKRFILNLKERKRIDVKHNVVLLDSQDLHKNSVPSVKGGASGV